MKYGFFSNGACFFFFRKFFVSTQNPSYKSKGLTITLFVAALWVSSVLLMCKVPAVWYAAHISVLMEKYDADNVLFAGGSTQYDRSTRGPPTQVSPNKGYVPLFSFDLLSATHFGLLATRMIGPAKCRLATEAWLFL